MYGIFTYVYLPNKTTKRRQIYMDGVGMIVKHLFNPNLLHLFHLNQTPSFPNHPQKVVWRKTSASQKPSKHLILAPWKPLSFPLAIAASCGGSFQRGPPPDGCHVPCFVFWEQQHDDFFGLEKVYETPMWAILLTV